MRAKAGTTGMEKRETKGCYALACVFVELGELDGGQPNGAGLGRDRLALLIETICATGIRGNEVRYITVEAAGTGVAQIAMKG